MACCQKTSDVGQKEKCVVCNVIETKRIAGQIWPTPEPDQIERRTIFYLLGVVEFQNFVKNIISLFIWNCSEKCLCEKSE